jgi:hypothetical protein
METLRLLMAITLAAFVASAQPVTIRELSPAMLIFQTSSGNVAASVGPDGALLIGTPSLESTAEISAALAKRTQSPLRYVVVAPQDLMHSQGDAGWVKRGAFVAMQELALQRLGGHAMGMPGPLPKQLLDLGAGRPPVSFSEVMTFDMNGDSIHIIHQKPGYSDADSVVHFHTAKLIYLGEVFPGDGYPLVDKSQGGDLNGIVATLRNWGGGNLQILPARGEVASASDLKDLLNVIESVRAKVKTMIDAHQSEQEVIAAHPSAEFDARYGQGRVKPDQFVHEIYASFSK